MQSASGGETLQQAGSELTRSPVRVKKQMSTAEFRKLTGHIAVGGAELAVGLLPGELETTKACWSPMTAGSSPLQTTKDLICSRSKGGIGAPFAENRDRPVAGVDIASPGGSYRSYYDMQVHRTSHRRCRNGPNEIFAFDRGPPISSYDHGFAESVNYRPPRFPISSTTISRTQSEILKTTGGSKGR
eukprot:TRINITY_DN15380_c0_g1_i1.p1 TRINITY_DN15380_c0_g1~~TRINITY_DN15380_c0_g1_i1.p1  ORF type:complete len:187 (+),score=20.58 TRINITY_DN15380_c0_g1_i1:63-623(+)